MAKSTSSKAAPKKGAATKTGTTKSGSKSTKPAQSRKAEEVEENARLVSAPTYGTEKAKAQAEESDKKNAPARTGEAKMSNASKDSAHAVTGDRTGLRNMAPAKAPIKAQGTLTEDDINDPNSEYNNPKGPQDERKNYEGNASSQDKQMFGGDTQVNGPRKIDL